MAALQLDFRCFLFSLTRKGSEKQNYHFQLLQALTVIHLHGK